MGKREIFTSKSTPKEDDGTLMGKKLFMLDKMHDI
jgi:hypothetical protein